MTTTRRRRATVALALASLLATVSLACGIPEESEPRAVAPERIPDQLETVPPTAPNTVEEVGQRETIFGIRTDADGDPHLAPWEITIGADPSPRSLVNSLLEEANNINLPAGMQNRVPDDLQVVNSDNEQDGVTVEEDLVRIRIDDVPLQNIQADRLNQAIAQIVWTATQVGGVERVQLIDLDDDPIPVNTAGGSKDVVTREDFSDLAPLGS
jgi:hypothetical protein